MTGCRTVSLEALLFLAARVQDQRASMVQGHKVPRRSSTKSNLTRSTLGYKDYNPNEPKTVESMPVWTSN